MNLFVQILLFLQTERQFLCVRLRDQSLNWVRAMTNEHSKSDERRQADRRSGRDTRNDTERGMVGERRSGKDRRTP